MTMMEINGKRICKLKAIVESLGMQRWTFRYQCSIRSIRYFLSESTHIASRFQHWKNPPSLRIKSIEEWFRRTPIFQISEAKRNVRGKYKRKLGFFGHYWLQCRYMRLYTFQGCLANARGSLETKACYEISEDS